MAMAFAFGSGPAIAAFMVAFRFANAIRRLFGEGTLSAGFIPHFEQLRGSEPEKGATFFRDVLFTLTIVLALVILLLEGILLAVWHWGGLSPDNADILFLTMLMLPGILFICLFGLTSALLQCERRYFLTGFAPVGFNLVWIASAWWLRDQPPAVAVVSLSLAIVVAFLVQWFWTLPATFSILQRSLTRKECLKPRLFSLEFRQMIKPFLLGAIGVGAVQINSALDAVFARCASLEGPAYLWYAIRIEQLPLALFGIALSSALLPPLARAIREKAHERYLQLIRFAFRQSFSLIFPCTMGLFVLGVVGINLLYGRGDFTQTSTYQTVLCLWGYGLGLVPAVFVLLLAPAFYAEKDYRLPTIASLISVGCNILLTSLFVFGLGWGAFSVSVATSLCAWLNYFTLSWALAKKIGVPLINREVGISYLKTVTCGVIAAVAVLAVGHYLVGDPTLDIFLGEQAVAFPRDVSTQVLQFIALSGVFVLIFFSYAWMLGAEEVLQFCRLLTRAPER